MDHWHGRVQHLPQKVPSLGLGPVGGGCYFKKYMSEIGGLHIYIVAKFLFPISSILFWDPKTRLNRKGTKVLGVFLKERFSSDDCICRLQVLDFFIFKMFFFFLDNRKMLENSSSLPQIPCFLARVQIVSDSSTVQTFSPVIITIYSFEFKEYVFQINVLNLLCQVFIEFIFNFSAPPIFKDNGPTDYTVDTGDKMKFRCSVKGYPKPVLLWYRKNALIPSVHDRIKMIRFSITISKVRRSDAGTYACHVSNPLGEKWKNFTLEVLGDDKPEDLSSTTPPVVEKDSEKESPPYFTKPEIMKKKVIAKPAGQAVTIKCPAGGNPVPTITWLKDGQPPKRRLNRHVQMRKWGLIMEDLTTMDNGLYTCILNNIHGTINATFSVDVIERFPHKPIIDKEVLRNQTVFVGDTAKFQCKFVSDLQPHMEWVRHLIVNGSYADEIGVPHVELLNTVSFCFVLNYVFFKIESKGFAIKTTFRFLDACTDEEKSEETFPEDKKIKTYVSQIKSQHAKTNLSEQSTDKDGNPQFLILRNVSVEDEGWYSCIARNTFGYTVQTVWLTVLPRLEKEDEADKDLQHLYQNTLPVSKSETKKLWSIKIWQIALGLSLLAVLIIAFISVACLLCRQKKRTRKALISNHQPIIKKVYIEHQNSDSSDASLTPLVKIDSLHNERCGNNRSRLSSEVTNYTEYEIPLDPKWEFSRTKLCIGKPLGEGAFGQVFKAEANGIDGNPDKWTITAVKMLKEGHSDEELANLILEVEVMKGIGGHRNIINLLGCCTQDGPLYVLVEYAPYGNLRDYLRSFRASSGYERPIGDTRPDPLTVSDMVSFAYQVAKGMDYLASRKCIHRDLAARNVLVAENKVVKIADFGLARDVHKIDYYKKKSDGRLPVKWMAPEALFDRVYTTQSDVWSYGVLLWEIMTLGGSPYPSVPVEKLFQLLKGGHRMPQPPNCPNEIYFLMRKSWETQPNQRPLFSELVENLDEILSKSSSQPLLVWDISESHFWFGTSLKATLIQQTTELKIQCMCGLLLTPKKLDDLGCLGYCK
ncbi:Fibroblast growth factor receptor 3 [Nymphon striatum]|nr:Fibroblast growth factor receptor 3 [Nymphon striatum]